MSSPFTSSALDSADHGLSSPDPDSARSETGFWLSIFVFIAVITALAAFGLIMLATAGDRNAGSSETSAYFFFRQSRWLILAVVIGAGAVLLPLEKIKRLISLGFIGTVGLLSIVCIPGIGVFRNGSRRWLQLPGYDELQIQVSDIAKITFVLALALCLNGVRKALAPDTADDARADAAARPRRPRYWWPWRFTPHLRYPWLEARSPRWQKFLNGFAAPVGIIGLTCGLIGLEPDLGTLALFAAVGGLLLLVNSVRLKFLLPLGAAAVAAFCVVVATWPDRVRRVTAFIDAEGTRLNEGHQLYQGFIGMGSGGVDGVGFGNGIQQRYYLPEAHTDFIYAIIGEEGGLYATSTVALLFLLLYLVVVLNLRHAHNPYQFNICLGAMLFIVLQALVNMGVVTGLFPTTGMSLPFISHGGTGLVIMFGLAGLIFNCLIRWRHPPTFGDAQETAALNNAAIWQATPLTTPLATPATAPATPPAAPAATPQQATFPDVPLAHTEDTHP
jgi:cell division protein FtsW